jgi:hypothetical protein
MPKWRCLARLPTLRTYAASRSGCGNGTSSSATIILGRSIRLTNV